MKNDLLIKAENIMDCLNDGVFLADLEGHGIAAALYAMHMSILWNRHFEQIESPAKFASAVNEELVNVFGSVVTFATAMCGVINVPEATLCFTGAGGPAPLIIHEDWAVEQPKSNGPPLGVMEDIHYKEETVKLQPGDSIFFFSDGAIEIQNAADEWLGVEGFIQILKNLNYPDTPLRMDVLEKKLLMFSNEIRLQDDITIIEGRFFG